MPTNRKDVITTARRCCGIFVILAPDKTRNSSGDEIANVNFLYDDIVHAVKIQ